MLALVRGSALMQMLAQMGGVPTELLTVLIPAVVALFAAMCPIAAPSVSLEGKSLWLLRSLPVTPWQVLRAKLAVHLTVTLPAALLCAVCLLLVVHPTLLLAALSLLLTALLCLLLALAALGSALLLVDGRFAGVGPIGVLGAGLLLAALTLGQPRDVPESSRDNEARPVVRVIPAWKGAQDLEKHAY